MKCGLNLIYFYLFVLKIGIAYIIVWKNILVIFDILFLYILGSHFAFRSGASNYWRRPWSIPWLSLWAETRPHAYRLAYCSPFFFMDLLLPTEHHSAFLYTHTELSDMILVFSTFARRGWMPHSVDLTSTYTATAPSPSQQQNEYLHIPQNDARHNSVW